MNLLIVLPVPLPGAGGLETHYTEIMRFFSGRGAYVILMCPKYVKKENNTGSFDMEINKTRLKLVRIPLTAPSLYYERERLMNYISLTVRILVFWSVCVPYVIYVVKKYRPKSCLMRHSLLLYPLPRILKLFKVKVVGDGDPLSLSARFFFRDRTLARHKLSKKGLVQNTILLRTITRTLELLEYRMFSNYDFFRAISPFVASTLRLNNFISSDKIVNIPPGIDISLVPYSSTRATDVAYFGVLEKIEGLEILIKSFAKVIKSHPYVKLHIFGDGPLLQDLQQMAKELNIASSVVLYGTLPREKLYYHFTEFGIAVFPRTMGYGHIPMKVIEALAAGKAVVATKIEGIHDVFSSDEILFVEPRNEVQLADAIIRLLEDQELREELARRGRLKARQFDAQSIYKALYDLIADTKTQTATGLI